MSVAACSFNFKLTGGEVIGGQRAKAMHLTARYTDIQIYGALQSGLGSGWSELAGPAGQTGIDNSVEFGSRTRHLT